MTEPFILEFAPKKLALLGYSKYFFKHRDFIVSEGETILIEAYNELYFIIEEPTGLIVDSDYGMFDSTDNPLPENIHVHRGEIKIINPGNVKRRIKFIQAVIVN
jgi:hypothetical protein